MALPEDAPLAEIETWFRDKGFSIVVHQDPPPTPDPRTTPRELRGAQKYTHGCEVRFGTDDQRRARWYGGGMSAEQAVRSARSRYRVEQEGKEPPRDQV